MAASRSRRHRSSRSDFTSPAADSPWPHPERPERPKRPCSQRKIEANRANAKKSTGPRTAAGKARSRLNAFVHGMTASLAVMPGEDLATVRRFFAGIYAELKPRGAAEAVLVDQYASIAWKLRRLGSAEQWVM